MKIIKKLWHLASLVTLITLSFSSYADWEDGPYGKHSRDFIHNGKILARTLGIPHFRQPTWYTCGSTTTSMQMVWETYKKGRATKFDILDIHSIMNTDGGEESGLNTDELKKGQAVVAGLINKALGIDMNLSMSEMGDSSIKQAISTLLQGLIANASPAILYGNVKNGSPGQHYYLAIGAAYCPLSICQSDTMWLHINDSFYNSPAYPEAVRKDAINPERSISYDDLEKYWKKTGYPWAKRHHFIANVN